MTDIPLILVAHADGSYSLGDTGDRIVLERVGLDEVTDYLEDRHKALHPAPTGDQLWDQYHPAVEPSINLTVDEPTFLTLAPDRKTSTITVAETTTGEVLATDVTARQIFAALSSKSDPQNGE
ncbi:hypothetical protein [Sphingobium yanoikuyae]|uniref:hypothetical protein n=1 Tax=Sphingobium yanoikuyae TaxID=13690 RepID=UPI000DB420D0|nr:MAG: hypothetical protein DI554_00390 [Sphingobium sp.]